MISHCGEYFVCGLPGCDLLAVVTCFGVFLPEVSNGSAKGTLVFISFSSEVEVVIRSSIRRGKGDWRGAGGISSGVEEGGKLSTFGPAMGLNRAFHGDWGLGTYFRGLSNAFTLIYGLEVGILGCVRVG
ncbi:hypothetical protein Tco_1351307 [Tanacetum coccineum]